MNRSEQINELAGALALAQLEMKAADKSSTNPHFKSKYAALPEVVEVAKVLNKHGLAYVQPASTSDNGSVACVETVLMHGKSGQWISEKLELRAQQNTPQGVGSAVTYARRFGLCALVGIVADEDDDGNAASKPAPVVPVDEDQSAIVADEFRAALAAATTQEKVLEIGAAIAKAGKDRRLTDADKDVLKPIFAARKKALATTEQATA